MTPLTCEVGLRLAEYDNPIHQIKPYVNMVFHHHQGFTGLFQHMAYRIMHFLDALRIEVGRRFVEQQQVAALLQGQCRFRRLRSPPDSTPTSFCWSEPLKPKDAT